MAKRYLKEDRDKRAFDFAKAKPVVFASLKPTKQKISLSLPACVLEKLGAEANRRGVARQAHIKEILAEAVGF